jgi:hypothetical protein
MFQSLRRWPAALLAAPVLLCLASGRARAQTFDEALEQCQAVTTPAALTTCAATQDPLKGGGAVISDEGDVTVTVFGGATNTSYAITFASNAIPPQTTTLGSLMTDANGNGHFRKDAFFKFGTVGSGNVVLTSTAGEEFVTGLTVSTVGFGTRRDFQPGLVRCTDVTVPGTLSGCGSDSLNSGRVDVEEDDGATLIHVSGARPSTSYTALFVSPSGTSVTLGTVGPTNKAGSATLLVGTPNPELPLNTIASGEIVLQSSSTNEFMSGFKVDQKFVRPKVGASTLEPCGSVTDPVLTNCGSDPLDNGSFKVEAGGQIIVTLKGASPSTNYEAWFRPVDNSGDQDTGIALPTDANGDAKSTGKFFTANEIASGTIVVKHTADDFDQFLGGYETH